MQNRLSFWDGEAVQKYAKNKDSITYYAQELKANTYNLTRMNLIMRKW